MTRATDNARVYAEFAVFVAAAAWAALTIALALMIAGRRARRMERTP